jgi:hypothetical protein
VNPVWFAIFLEDVCAEFAEKAAFHPARNEAVSSSGHAEVLDAFGAEHVHDVKC